MRIVPGWGRALGASPPADETAGESNRKFSPQVVDTWSATLYIAGLLTEALFSVAWSAPRVGESASPSRPLAEASG